MANLLDESYIYAILDMPKINYQIVDGVKQGNVIFDVYQQMRYVVLVFLVIMISMRCH